MSLFGAQRYALGRAGAMVRQRPEAFLLGVFLSAAALAVPLGLASLGWAAWPVLAQVRPAPEFSVFVAPRATAREVEALKARIGQLAGVAKVTLEPKDAALARLAKRSGFSGPIAELGANPLPDVLIARLSPPLTPAAVEGMLSTVRTWPLVDGVRSDLDWYRKLQALGRLGFAILGVFGALVMLLVALVLVGTVRLHAAARADEVALLKLVGATNRFIVRPYAYSAVLTLGVAALVAIGFVHGVHAALRGPLFALTELYGSPFALPGPEPRHVAAVCLAAVVFGWVIGSLGGRAAVADIGR